MFRIFDFSLALLGLLCLWPIFLIVYVCGLLDTGAPLFYQERVGKNKKKFILVKFRTMKVGTPSAASHLTSANSITSMGRLLRKSKIDELPQLINVIKGEMSLVGPRPCLFNQNDLIKARDRLRVFDVRPGVTGLAQISDIDMSTPELLAETDARMIQKMSIKNYFKYLFKTLSGRGLGDRVKD